MMPRVTGNAARAAAILILSLPAFAAGAGTPAPDFTLTARDGGTVSLAKHRGEVIVLNFWATWCGPCRKEMPLLESIHRRYQERGLTLIGVNVERDPKAADAWLRQTPVTFPIVYDTESKVSQLYKVNGMPSTVFIDRRGNLRRIHQGYKPGDENEYLDQIRKLLRE